MPCSSLRPPQRVKPGHSCIVPPLLRKLPFVVRYGTHRWPASPHAFPLPPGGIRPLASPGHKKNFTRAFPGRIHSVRALSGERDKIHARTQPGWRKDHERESKSNPPRENSAPGGIRHPAIDEDHPAHGLGRCRAPRGVRPDPPLRPRPGKRFGGGSNCPRRWRWGRWGGRWGG